MSLWGSGVVQGSEGRQLVTRTTTVKRRQDLFFSYLSAHPQKNRLKRRGFDVGEGVKVLSFTPGCSPIPITSSPASTKFGVNRGRGAQFFSCCRVSQVEQQQKQQQQDQFNRDEQQQQLYRENEGQSQICEFLKGKTLFITGSTGFLAKVLVEKILFEQPDVKKIYLLIQSRNGMSAEDRLKEQVLSSPAFARIKEQQGENFEEFMMSKLQAVQGDLSAPKMGIDQETFEQLQGDIEVAVNSAATTTFDERYDFAIRLNTLGAQEMARFAAGCKNLKLLVHVSTAYVNGMREGVGLEDPFRMGHTIIQELNGQNPTDESLDIDQEIKRAYSAYETFKKEVRSKNGRSEEDLEAEIVEKLKVFGMQRAQQLGWQDTYVFTKAMGEMLVGEETAKSKIPTVILRPSIVESAYKEPLRGWMEGIRMADPIIIAYGKGQVFGFAGDKDRFIDIIPVDFVINSLLATMPKHADTPGLTVYQSATSNSNNPNSIGQFARYVSEHFWETPMFDKNGPVKVDEMRVYQSQELFLFDVWKQYKLPFQIDQVRSQFLMWMQAGNSDSQSNINRKKQLIAQKTQEQFSYLAKIYTPYTFYKCQFDVARLQELFGSLSKEDQEKFYFDVESIDWAEYVKNIHIPGLRKFVLKGR